MACNTPTYTYGYKLAAAGARMLVTEKYSASCSPHSPCNSH